AAPPLQRGVASFAEPAQASQPVPLAGGRRCEVIHEPLAYLDAGPSRHIGAVRHVIGNVIEADGVASSQGDTLAEVDEAERTWRLATQRGAQAIRRVRAQDRGRERAHTHRDPGLFLGEGGVTRGVNLGMSDRAHEGIDEYLVPLVDVQPRVAPQWR